MVGQLILTLTRACQLRCSYCPTVKEGWPSLSRGQALRALELFDTLYGGGDVKLGRSSQGSALCVSRRPP